MTSGIGGLATRLASGEKLLLAWCGMTDASSVEILLREGFDAALLDMQHGMIDVASAMAGIVMAASIGKPALVRVPVGDFAMGSRMLDAGAAAIVAPMINNVEDARRLASYAKYPPLGDRSWGPYRALPMSGKTQAAFLAEANTMQLAIAMIETREALAALNDILSVEGIDGVLVGPADLSIALSEGGKVDPNGAAVDAALTRILQETKRHNKIACLFCSDGDRARELAHRGFQLLSIGTDQVLLRMSAKAEIEKARRA